MECLPNNEGPPEPGQSMAESEGYIGAGRARDTRVAKA
jgi:hypothetical protein